MNLISTKRPSRRWQRRGTAEIETALVIPLLLIILILVGGTLTFGLARLNNLFGAENEAYRQTVAETDVTTSTNPVTGIEAVRPGLPNYFAMVNKSTDVRLRIAGSITDTTLEDRAYFLTPSWHYGDQAVDTWFEEYVGESHPSDLVMSLGLKPAVPP